MAGEATINRNRVAVIGAGVAGLTSIKSCLEDGLEPVCYERHDRIGGLWNYSDVIQTDQGAAVYHSVVTNNSKEMLAFSDFPFPKECTSFMSHREVVQYLVSYAQHFDLEKYIKFNTNVMKIERNRDDGDGQYWKVLVKYEDDSVNVEYFDYVMVCIGMFNKSFTPDYPGLDTFNGIKIHGNEYRDAFKFKEKRVVVVGGSHTAGEISCEIAKHGSKVYLSMRHGTYAIPRILIDGLPWDFQFFKRCNFRKSSSQMEHFLDGLFKTRISDYKSLGLHSTESILKTSSLMINDDIQDRVSHGQLTPVGDIAEIQGDNVILTNGTVLKDIDGIVFATGYEYSIPIIDQSWIYDDSNNVLLYKYIFPTALQNPERMSMIGMLSYLGPVWPMLEMQARWATKIFTGKVKLPDKKIMVRDIENSPRYIGKQYKYVSFFPYIEDIAEVIGVKPSLWKLLFSDPKLAYAFQYGPMVPYWYRLQGPNTWNGAKDAILNVLKNTTYPTRRYRADEEMP
ncbi:dimethylaniline monooxygenase [N-oxide-forming] 2-like [Glandiceps talaboti]